MTYAEKFIRSKGKQCTILRTPEVESYVSIKRSTKAIRDLSAREAYFDGLILLSSNLESGELFQIGSDKYITQTVYTDPASGEISFFAVKTNAVITHQVKTKSLDDDYNIIETWEDEDIDVAVFGTIITDSMRQYEPGLLDSARYLFQMSKDVSITERDRIVYDSKNLVVVSIDDIGLEGVYRLQAGLDTRP
jgi:hypothetical protein